MAREETLVLKLKLESNPKNLKTIKELTDRNKALKKILKDAPREGQEGFKELQGSIEKAKKEFVANQKEIVKFNKSLKVTAKDTEEFANDSLKGLSKNLRNLEQEYKGLSKAQRDAAEGKKLQKNIRDTRDELLKAEKALGDFRRQVGNYEKTLKGVSSTLKRLFVGRSIAEGLRSIGGFLSDVIEKNKNTDQSINELSGALAKLRKAGEKAALIFLRTVGPAIAFLANGAASLIETFFGVSKVSNEATNAFFEQSKSVQKLDNQVTPLSKKYDELSSKAKLSKKEQSELNDITNELASIVPTAAEEFDEYGNVLKVSTSKVSDFVEKQKQLLELQKQIAISEQTTNLAEYRRELDKLNDVVDKANKGASFEAAVLKELGEDELKLRRNRLEASVLETELKLKQLNAVNTQAEAQEDEEENRGEKQLNRLQKLQQQQSVLREKIQLLTLAQKDASKEAESLREVNKKLKEAQEALNKAEQEELDIFEQRAKKVEQLNKSIKERLESGEDVDAMIQDLIQVTKEITEADERFAAVQKTVNEATRDYAQGSLTDLNNRISTLQEEQSKLVVNSIEYINKQAEINALEKERTTNLELLKTKTDEFRLAQQLLNSQIDDRSRENSFIQKAKEDIAALTSIGEQRAKDIKAIEEKLAKDLQNIRTASLNAQDQSLKTEINKLEDQKEREVALVMGNEEKKAAIIELFDAKINDAKLQQLNIQKQLLQQDFEAVKENEDKKVAATIEAQEKKIKTLEEEEAKRKAIRDAAIQATFQVLNQISSAVFQRAEENRQQALQNELDRLDKSQQEAEKSLSRFTNTEERRAQIETEFNAKREKANKEAAKKQKTLALIQAGINTALAVTNALATVQPFLPAGVAAAAVAAVTGAVQVGLIASKKFKRGKAPKRKAARGMVTRGRRHEQGGIPALLGGREMIEVEDNEAIINRDSTSKHYHLLSAINEDQGGVPFPNANRNYVKIFDSIFKDSPEMIPIARRGFAPQMPALQTKKFYQNGGLAISAGGQTATVTGDIFSDEDIKLLAKAIREGAKEGVEDAEIEQNLTRQNERDNRRSGDSRA